MKRCLLFLAGALMFGRVCFAQEVQYDMWPNGKMKGLHIKTGTGVKIPVKLSDSTDIPSPITVDIRSAPDLTVKQSTPTNMKTQVFGDDTTKALDVDSDGQLQIDVLTLPPITGTVAVTGTFWQETQPVSIASMPTTPVTLSDLSFADTIVEVTCTDTALWYPITLPANTVLFSMSSRTPYDFKVSKNSDGTWYKTVWAGSEFKGDPVRDGYWTGTYYANSPISAGLVIELRVAVKQ